MEQEEAAFRVLVAEGDTVKKWLTHKKPTEGQDSLCQGCWGWTGERLGAKNM